VKYAELAGQPVERPTEATPPAVAPIGDPAARPGPGGPQGHPGQHGPAADGRTRALVARMLMEDGPVTAAAVAKQLGLSPAAVRRHLDALLADGEATTRDQPRRGPRGRGRPAKLFLLTEAGRARFGHAYDDLAVAALRFLAERGGSQAVRDFAEQRVAALIGRHREVIAAGRSTSERAKALAGALTREGYAASAKSITLGGVAGEQLCQHHCPVAHVAAEFPELCEVETAAFAELLGTHVQRLATIARGDAACTTHVPLGGPEPAERTASTTKEGTPS
jgi:predicted ArsR family transcriptional regulator